MIKFLDLSKELISIKEEIENKINKIMFYKTNFILGSEVEQFENNFAKYININHCIGVANGTDALEMAVKSLNLDSDDEIITQANTYVATCFGISNNNIKLKLVDIDPSNYHMDLELLEKSINKKTKAVIIVHLTGSSCDMDKLMGIINKHNLILIEDCAQSHGAYFKTKRLGTFGKLSTFSFYPGKNLGAFGDGGAICTNDDDLALFLKKLRNNGSIEKYKHEMFGRNSRLDTLQAAILDIKLTNLDSNNEKRRQKSDLYYKYLNKCINIQLPEIINGCIPVYHLFIIRAEKRDELREYLTKQNIETIIHYPISISDLKCYEGVFNNNEFQNSIINSKNILSLPMYPDITEEEIKTVCNEICSFYSSQKCWLLFLFVLYLFI